eukprot:GHVS01085212.1.p1 GENE.GHVS01085212.1~~GHVS01085212.1.p1  ORF type:complete len:610 (+),score=105.43 GHVS01085212.1:86-1915(+)
MEGPAPTAAYGISVVSAHLNCTEESSVEETGRDSLCSGEATSTEPREQSDEKRRPLVSVPGYRQFISSVVAEDSSRSYQKEVRVGSYRTGSELSESLSAGQERVRYVCCTTPLATWQAQQPQQPPLLLDAPAVEVSVCGEEGTEEAPASPDPKMEDRRSEQQDGNTSEEVEVLGTVRQMIRHLAVSLHLLETRLTAVNAAVDEENGCKRRETRELGEQLETCVSVHNSLCEYFRRHLPATEQTVASLSEITAAGADREQRSGHWWQPRGAETTMEVGDGGAARRGDVLPLRKLQLELFCLSSRLVRSCQQYSRQVVRMSWLLSGSSASASGERQAEASAWRVLQAEADNGVTDESSRPKRAVHLGNVQSDSAVECNEELVGVLGDPVEFWEGSYQSQIVANDDSGSSTRSLAEWSTWMWGASKRIFGPITTTAADRSSSSETAQCEEHSYLAVWHDPLEHELQGDALDQISELHKNVTFLRSLQKLMAVQLAASEDVLDQATLSVCESKQSTQNTVGEIGQLARKQSRWWGLKGSGAGAVAGGMAGLICLGPVGLIGGLAVGSVAGMTTGNALKARHRRQISKAVSSSSGQNNSSEESTDLVVTQKTKQ